MDPFGFVALAISALVIIDLAAPHLAAGSRSRRHSRRASARR